MSWFDKFVGKKPAPKGLQGAGRGVLSPLLGGLTLGTTVAAPAAVGLGNYLRSPQGTLMKDRLGQGDLMGAFSAVTGLGGPTAPRLQQYNPPGFNPAAPITFTDLSQSVQALTKTPSVEDKTFASVDSRVERAYQDEKRRATQLASQDELAKKYRVADLTKAYNAAKGDEKERIGLEIWATTNPQLAQKLKPGQLGYNEAVFAFRAASPLGSLVNAAGDLQYANKLTTTPLSGSVANIAFKTPLTGVDIPQTPQFGVSEAFQATAPSLSASQFLANPLETFKPDLSETQRKLLIEAFNKGIK